MCILLKGALFFGNLCEIVYSTYTVWLFDRFSTVILGCDRSKTSGSAAWLACFCLLCNSTGWGGVGCLERRMGGDPPTDDESLNITIQSGDWWLLLLWRMLNDILVDSSTAINKSMHSPLSNILQQLLEAGCIFF